MKSSAKPPREEVRGRRALVALDRRRRLYQQCRSLKRRDAKLMRAGVASYFIQVNTEEFVENALLKDCGEGVCFPLNNCSVIAEFSSRA